MAFLVRPMVHLHYRRGLRMGNLEGRVGVAKNGPWKNERRGCERALLDSRTSPIKQRMASRRRGDQ